MSQEVLFPELQTLSGYKRPHDVKQWCGRQRIHFFTNRDGHPVTTRAALDRALTGGDNGRTLPKFKQKQARGKK